MVMVSLIILLAVVVPVALIFIRGQGWRKALRVLGIVTTSLLAVFASGLMLLMWSCTPPTVETLQNRFPKQRKDLETIVAMSNQDKHLLRIDPDWLLNDTTGQFTKYDPTAGITLERWNEYRRLFARNSITQGIQRQTDSDDAFIMVKSEGLLDRGISNGYLFCGQRPVHRYEPCIHPAARGKHAEDSQVEGGYEFIRLDGGWYAFSSGPG
jgi:hypothetical protein